MSLPPRLLRLLPAGAKVAGRGSHPLRDSAFARRTNYPDLEGMVAGGLLIYKSGWYEATNKEAYDAIIQYATSIRVSKERKAQIKVARASKRLKALAEKL